MKSGMNPTVLIVPGLRYYVADHWQTLLEERLPNAVSVPPLQSDRLSRAAWVAALEQALARIRGRVVLVAHSTGVMTVAQWARQHDRPIHGALLVTPPDFVTPLPPGYPTAGTLQANGWFPVPQEPLPFPSIVAASSNDPVAGYSRVVGMAKAWGSRVFDLGDVGHLNPASGYGEWPQAEALIHQLY